MFVMTSSSSTWKNVNNQQAKLLILHLYWCLINNPQWLIFINVWMLNPHHRFNRLLFFILLNKEFSVSVNLILRFVVIQMLQTVDFFEKHKKMWMQNQNNFCISPILFSQPRNYYLRQCWFVSNILCDQKSKASKG